MTFLTPKQIDDLLKQILNQTVSLAQKLFDKYWKEARLDIQTFLTNSKGNLIRWAQEVTDKKISQDEFNELVKEQIALSELHAIKQTDLKDVEIDTFVSGATSIITTVLLSALTVAK